MKMDMPHDVPTHQLENPDQYITKVGKFIRAHSLDELPQIWDIFIGDSCTLKSGTIVKSTSVLEMGIETEQGTVLFTPLEKK